MVKRLVGSKWSETEHERLIFFFFLKKRKSSSSQTKQVRELRLEI